MKKVNSLAVLLVLIVLVFIGAALTAKSAGETKQINKNETFVKPVEIQQLPQIQITYPENEIIKPVIATPQQEPQKPERPRFKNPIPLPEETLNEIYEICLENDISYTLVLAIAEVESNFDPKAKSSTGDSGLMQINRKTQTWLAEKAGIENVQSTKPSHSVLMAVEYLLYLRNYFDEFDLSEEDKFNYVVGGYNYGHVGIQRYAKKRDISNHPYVKKVLAEKEKLEMSVIE